MLKTQKHASKHTASICGSHIKTTLAFVFRCLRHGVALLIEPTRKTCKATQPVAISSNSLVQPFQSRTFSFKTVFLTYFNTTLLKQTQTPAVHIFLFQIEISLSITITNYGLSIFHSLLTFFPKT